jgi:hypothetical protein
MKDTDMKNYFRKGSMGIGQVLFITFFIIFIVFPVFSFLIDKNIARLVASEIKESLDMSVIGAYNAVNENQYGKKTVDISQKSLENEFLKLFCKNMKLDKDLSPKDGSILEYPIKINELEYFGPDRIGDSCPCGNEVVRPMVHLNFTFSLNPTLYRRVINRMSGKDKFSISIGYDIELPYDK